MASLAPGARICRAAGRRRGIRPGAPPLVAVGARCGARRPWAAHGGGPGAAQRPARTELDAPAGSEPRGARRRHHHRRRPGPGGHAPRARPGRRAPPRDRQSQLPPPGALLAARSARTFPRDRPHTAGDPRRNRPARSFIPRTGRSAQPVPRAGAGACQPAPGQLDTPQLRHRHGRSRARARAAHAPSRRRRHPAVARRPRGAHAAGHGGDPRGAAAAAGGPARRAAQPGDAARHAHRGRAGARGRNRRGRSMSHAPAPTPLVNAASAYYRTAGRFALHFARAKLARDPAFALILAQGLLAGRSRLIDPGCGQGLLAAWLLAAHACHAQGAPGGWPAGWPAPPLLEAYTGIEINPSEVARARRAFALDPGAAVQVGHGDIRDADYPAADAVVILDVLHYLDHTAQERVLRRLRAALLPHGLLLLRIADATGGVGFVLGTTLERPGVLLRRRRGV